MICISIGGDFTNEMETDAGRIHEHKQHGKENDKGKDVGEAGHAATLSASH